MFIFMCSFSAKVTCAFFAYKKQWILFESEKSDVTFHIFFQIKVLGYRLLFLHGGSLEITLSIPLRIVERREYEIGLENGENIQVELKKNMNHDKVFYLCN